MINLCSNRRVLGVSCDDYRQDGAFAEYAAIPQHILYKLPDEVSYEQACLVEPLSIAFHAVGLSQININDTVVVIGAGMIGLLIIQTLRMVGCGELIAIDIDEKKLKLAKDAGADRCLLSDKDKVRDYVLDITDGEGADVAFDAVGINASLGTALSCLKKGGHITLVGNLAPTVDLPLQKVVTGQIRMQGSCASSGEYTACLDMIARKSVKIDPLISKTAPLEEGQKWFDVLYERKSDLLKVILKP
jgi:L-iditol 2-dehydrogenase